MDFVVGLPVTGRKYDSVWVVVDRLTKSAHFLPVRTDYSLDKLVELYIREIVHAIEFQHIVPPADGWTIEKSDPSVGRYAEKLCD